MLKFLVILLLTTCAHAATFVSVIGPTSMATFSLTQTLPAGFIAANAGAYVYGDSLTSIVGGGWEPAYDLVYLQPAIDYQFTHIVNNSGISVLPPYSFYDLTDGKQDRLIPGGSFLINRNNVAVWGYTNSPIFDNRWDIAGTLYTSSGFFNYGDVVSLVVPTGDENFDGVVDLSDLSIVLDSFGGSDAWSDIVGLTDVSDVLNNFGTTYFHEQSTAIESSPEPSSILILVVSVFLLQGRNKHANA